VGLCVNIIHVLPFIQVVTRYRKLTFFHISDVFLWVDAFGGVKDLVVE